MRDMVMRAIKLTLHQKRFRFWQVNVTGCAFNHIFYWLFTLLRTAGFLTVIRLSDGWAYSAFYEVNGAAYY